MRPARSRLVRRCGMRLSLPCAVLGAYFISAWVLPDCSSPEGSLADAATQDSSTDPHVQCPPKAATCATPCYPIAGQKIDETRQCLEPAETVACWSGTGGALGAVDCIVDKDTGAHYAVGSISYVGELGTSGEWSSCYTSVSQPCPSDAGGGS